MPIVPFFSIFSSFSHFVDGPIPYSKFVFQDGFYKISPVLDNHIKIAATVALIFLGHICLSRHFKDEKIKLWDVALPNVGMITWATI